MPPITPTARLADLLLEGLDEFVLTRRAEGMSWRRIALEISHATGRQIEPTHESVRQWFPDQAATP
jgi:hypothetical protein